RAFARPAFELRQEHPRRLSFEESAFADLEGNACLEQRFLVQRRPEVDAIEDGDLAQRDALALKGARACRDERGLVLVRLVRADHRPRPRSLVGRQLLDQNLTTARFRTFLSPTQRTKRPAVRAFVLWS